MRNKSKGKERETIVRTILMLYYLTRKCLSYFSLPFVNKGGGCPLGPIHF